MHHISAQYLDVYVLDLPKSYFPPKEHTDSESPRAILSNYSSTKQVLCDLLWKIWHIQIKIYSQTVTEPKYGEFNLNN